MYGLVCLWYDIDVWLGMFVVCIYGMYGLVCLWYVCRCMGWCACGIYGCMGWCVCGMYVDVWVGVFVDVWLFIWK